MGNTTTNPQPLIDALAVVNGDAPYNWANARPSYISPAAWSAMVPNLIASAGSTVGQCPGRPDARQRLPDGTG